MLLKNILIENFRGIKKLDLPLDKLVVVIGENNSGKSTLVDAIRYTMLRSSSSKKNGLLSDYDFHLCDTSATPHTAYPIKITLQFSENNPNEWPDQVVQQLSEIIQFNMQNGTNNIYLRLQGMYQESTSSYESTWDFLNDAGQELSFRNASVYTLLSRFVPFFVLSALRDASQEFGQRGQFWSSFLKSIKLPQDQKEEVEGMLSEVNDKLIASDRGLLEVTRKIANLGRHVPLQSSDPVSLEAVPTRVFDILGKVQVQLKSPNGVKLPLQRYGDGTQSLAVLMLFHAFTMENLSSAYTPHSTPLLALEEPEAHLHPSAIRSLGTFLNNLSDQTGQVIVTSHSGDLVSRVPITSIRRLYKQGGETKVGVINSGSFTDKELQAINYSIRLTRGHYLFSRCWLFVEGETEFFLLPIIFDLMGYSLDSLSVSIIVASQESNKGAPLMKLANTLGIEWYLVADNDSGGHQYVAQAQRNLRSGEQISDRAVQTQSKDIEHEFWYNGYEDIFRNNVPAADQASIAQRCAGDLGKEVETVISSCQGNVGGKPAFALMLNDEIKTRGVATIPQSIQAMVRKVVQLSGGI